ncbi:Translation initiation factor 1A [Mortierella claussenii]|nr:Translation initiation factor 1A [Mortierella claussenii]
MSTKSPNSFIDEDELEDFDEDELDLDYEPSQETAHSSDESNDDVFLHGWSSPSSSPFMDEELSDEYFQLTIDRLTATRDAIKRLNDPLTKAQFVAAKLSLDGGKNRRRGKNENEGEKRELVFKEDGQEYAQVLKMLGNGRVEAQCFDGEKRLAHIRGKMRKKVWINQGDIILISLRDFQDDKADVILKYNTEEARNLKAYGELPESAKINETDTFQGSEDELDVEFDIDEI